MALAGLVGCGSGNEQPRNNPRVYTLEAPPSNFEWLYTVKGGNTNEVNKLSLWIDNQPINTWSHTGKAKDLYKSSLRGNRKYEIKLEAHHEVPAGSNHWVENKYRMRNFGGSVAFETEDSTDNNFEDMGVLFQLHSIN